MAELPVTMCVEVDELLQVLDDNVNNKHRLAYQASKNDNLHIRSVSLTHHHCA